MKCFKCVEWFRMFLLRYKEKEKVKSNIHAFLLTEVELYPNQSPKVMLGFNLMWYRKIVLYILVCYIYHVSFLLRFLYSRILIKLEYIWTLCEIKTYSITYAHFVGVGVSLLLASTNRFTIFVLWHFVDLMHQDCQILHFPMGKYFYEIFTF